MPKQTNKFQLLAERVAKALDADLLFYNAPVERHFDQRVIELCCNLRRRPNVALFLVTSGGDADAAYRISRCLQTKYQKFSLFVPGFCKSAGTLIALGANELIISDHGENGPLDVQMARKDELASSESGLTAAAALTALNEQAYKAFESFLLKITRGAGPFISTRTVADIAIKMTCGLFSPIYQQVDPMHVGEAERALEVAKAYGLRLATHSKNLAGETEESVEHLISHYPSHGFIIDFGEAKRIFKNVREFTAQEAELVGLLGPLARWPVTREEDQRVIFISEQTPGRRLPARDRKGRSNAGQKKPRSARRHRDRKGNATAATRTGPAVVTELPAVSDGRRP